MPRKMRSVEPTVNDHNFKCLGCDNHFTTARFAAKCHKVGALNITTGESVEFSAQAESNAAAEDARAWEAIYAECHYMCSCGESYRSIAAAQACRKCRTYTEEGYCTEVVDRDTDTVVWTIHGNRLDAAASADFNQGALTHNPFASLQVSFGVQS